MCVSLSHKSLSHISKLNKRNDDQLEIRCVSLWCSQGWMFCCSDVHLRSWLPCASHCMTNNRWRIDGVLVWGMHALGQERRRKSGRRRKPTWTMRASMNLAYGPCWLLIVASCRSAASRIRRRRSSCAWRYLNLCALNCVEYSLHHNYHSTTILGLKVHKLWNDIPCEKLCNLWWIHHHHHHHLWPFVWEVDKWFLLYSVSFWIWQKRESMAIISAVKIHSSAGTLNGNVYPNFSTESLSHRLCVAFDVNPVRV